MNGGVSIPQAEEYLRHIERLFQEVAYVYGEFSQSQLERLHDQRKLVSPPR
jgi:hypothetical protein